MREGTKSYLFGCHSFFFHPLFVLIAWIKVHRSLPAPWELVCIFLHDIGHIGTDYLTSYREKKTHWRLGAFYAYRLFGRKGFRLCAGHTKSSGFPRSKLFLPDKMSWIVAPNWWLEINRIVEPQLRAATVAEFKAKVRENIDGGCRRGNHDIYLEYSAKARRNLRQCVSFIGSGPERIRAENEALKDLFSSRIYPGGAVLEYEPFVTVKFRRRKR